MTGCKDITCNRRAECHRASERDWSNGTLDMAWLRIGDSCGAFVPKDEIREEPCVSAK